MGSWFAEKHVTRWLPGYAEQALTPKEQARVERHLARCAYCRQALNTLLSARLSLAGAAVVAAPDTLWNSIEARLPAIQSSTSNSLLQGELPAASRRVSSAGRHNMLRPYAAGHFRWLSISRLTWTTLVACCLLIIGVAGDVMQEKRFHDKIAVAGSPPPAWQVSRLRGTPMVGSARIAGVARLKVGQSLVTGSGDSARVQVADIGQVDVAPNSRLRLVETRDNLHRLALDRGELHAQVLAPPRLFLVDTPSAVAVDLGCSYTLKVDAAGNTRLQVTTGHVALEGRAQSVEVPAGAVCLTRKGVGTGTPFFSKAPAKLKAATQKFDFEKGGDAALTTILKLARVEDTLTLFHLLPRVSSPQRERVINGLLTYIDFPEGVTRQGVRRLDPKMLAAWKERMVFFWY